MNDHLVRQATTDDAAQMLDLRIRSIQALSNDHYSEDQIAAWIGIRSAEDYQKWIGLSPFFVCMLGKNVVGYAAYNPRSQELLAVYVDPDYVRQGVATSLVEALLTHAREHSVDSLWLDASLNAVPFYKAVGFAPVKETTHAFDGVPLECLRMKTDV